METIAADVNSVTLQSGRFRYHAELPIQGQDVRLEIQENGQSGPAVYWLTLADWTRLVIQIAAQ
jgi:hypothetical protein